MALGLGITLDSGLLAAGGAALVAGLAGSLHCFGMCGPLACAGCSKSGSRTGSMVAWHLARIVGYVLVGTALGAFGSAAADTLAVSTSGWLPWATALLLVATAFGVFDRLPELFSSARLLRPVAKMSANVSPTTRAALLGAVVPFLPCGLLYGLYLSTAASGSALNGGTIALAFAVGGVPALTLAQLQTSWIRRLPRLGEVLLRRAVPLAAAAMLVWRAVSGPDCPGCVG